MAWLPISGIVPQATESGNQANGMVLKFYEPGTLTPLAMAIDSTGVTKSVEFILNTQGYTTLSTVEVIPHSNQIYKAVLYLDQADADANDTGSAVWKVDNVDSVGSLSNAVTASILNSAINTIRPLDDLISDVTIPFDTNVAVESLEYITGTGQGGGRYQKVSANPGDNLVNVATDDGNWLELIPDNDFNVFQCGATADYDPTLNTGTDDTAAFNAAIQYYPKTSPAFFSGWGIGTIKVPKGNYLINGVVDRGVSIIGLIWEGAGEDATTLHTNIDTGSMFDMNTLIKVMFTRMSFTHVPVGAQATWTKILFDYSGASGGRNFALEHVSTLNFNTVIKHQETVNEDTTKVDHCTFLGCTTFLDSENTQAVVNTYSNCTWAGDIDRVFWIAGQQQTLITSGNVVQNGTFIEYKDISGKFNTSGLTMINVKFEWDTINASPGSPPKIIQADGQFISANVRMIDCAIRGGPTPDADARWIFVGSGQVHVVCEGGEYEGLIEVERRTNYFNERLCYIQLKDLNCSSPDTWVFTDPGTSGAVYPNISLENCRTGGVPINLTIAKGGCAALVQPARTVAITSTGGATTSFFSGTNSVDYDLFGQRVLIKSVTLMVKSTSNLSNKTINIYSDAAKLVLIGTLSPSDVSVTDKSYDIPLTGLDLDTSEGIYCEVVNPVTTLKAYFMAEFTSF